MQPLALVRTYVPLAVGVVLSYLATLGVHVNSSTQAGLIAGLTGILSAAYYTLAHLLESRWPVLSLLLGANATPSYTKPSTGSAAPVAGQDATAPENLGH